MPHPQPRVLVLEDNPALAESIEFALATFGLQVVGPFEGNDSASQRIRAGEVDVAVLDLELGDGTSIPTASQLRAAGLPFLFMSGHDMDEQVPAEFQNEMSLPKPVEPEILVDAIRELLAACSSPKTA
ncbi:DNA-binding response regulator CreB [Planctomycetes bacterium Poly30]|uniref:DNA-binding response regulator CreB n=1 Tax=Saltatorellus ferox TaxID=2528018 RepID=A0A518EYA3_9BACT|nr:DNA-binding response regulator CreB [Planctomycetes bacterium Poly30]